MDFQSKTETDSVSHQLSMRKAVGSIPSVSTACVVLAVDPCGIHTSQGAHGVVVSHPLRMRKALGSNPSVSMFSEHHKPGITNWSLGKVSLLCHDVLNTVMSAKS